ncbi:MAG: NAD(P)-dependent oxidoreductase [Candidatus Latescibacterota bacterium]|nr:NAD(P)-dependent oxidoreductase [Candidatus Latescibacterota bacterium]
MIASEDQLLEVMTAPSDQVREAVACLRGDVVVLGVAGKMGPSLAQLLVRAGADQEDRRVVGVSRFSDPGLRSELDRVGVTTIQADLLDEEALAGLPDAPHVFLMAGFKFGATGSPSLTWAMNSLLPERVVERYRDSEIVYVSSGNIYGYTPVSGPGSSEDHPLEPVGEYAQSRLGGERLALFAAERFGVRLHISRLFYATELRYGIIHDLAWKIREEEEIDLTMGHVNQIWQGDANGYLARSLALCTSPATILNMTGADTLSVRTLCHQLGKRMNREPRFIGKESDEAILGDASRLFGILGPPPTPIEDAVDWVAAWVAAGGRSLGKPTKYESRSGSY